MPKTIKEIETTPPPKKQARSYTLGEEIANSVSHGVGIGLSLAALVILSITSARIGGIMRITSGLVYSFTLLFLYTSSTLYHSIPIPSVKYVLRIIDHTAIYLLIAGTYTPFTLICLRESSGLHIFCLVWALAILGILYEMTPLRRFRITSILLYLFMGWVILVAIGPLKTALAPRGFQLLVAGGVFYTLGVFFYTHKKLPYHHMIWHLFVLCGSILHFFSVLFYAIVM